MNKKQETNVDKAVQVLINGGTTSLDDSIFSEVQERLREIKRNCTEVLSQMKEMEREKKYRKK